MILPLEKQVCDLEHAKIFKDLGVKQKSHFYWWEGEDINEECQSILRIELENNNNSPSNFSFYAAFTVAELGEILPNNIGEKYLTSHMCSRGGWWIFYSKVNDKDNDNDACWDFSEANARAKMIIHLIENGFVKVEDINAINQ